MALSEQKKGEFHSLLSAFLNGFFPVVVVLSYTTLPSLIALAWTTLFAAFFFAGVLSYRKLWYELRDPRLWRYGAAIAFFIGFGVYGLYFLGLEQTTPGNASIIILFEVFTSFVFFRLFKGERLSFDYAIGAVLVTLGALIVLGRDFSSVHTGDLLIFATTLIAPVGNYFQQKARTIASSESTMFLRSILSIPLILLLAIFFGSYASFRDVFTSLPFLVVNGILLLGLAKMFWIEAIHRISVAKATALASIAPFVTLLCAWLILNQSPTLWQFLSLIPFVLGTLLLTDYLKLKR